MQFHDEMARVRDFDIEARELRFHITFIYTPKTWLTNHINDFKILPKFSDFY